MYLFDIDRSDFEKNLHDILFQPKTISKGKKFLDARHVRKVVIQLALVLTKVSE